MSSDTLSSRKLPYREVVAADRSPALGGALASKSVRHYVSAFFKHKKVIFLLFAALMVLSCPAAFVYHRFFAPPPLYQAKSLVLVKAGWEHQSPEINLQGNSFRGMNPNEVISSEQRIAGSRVVKERTIEAIGPLTLYPQLESAQENDLPVSEIALMRFNRDFDLDVSRNGMMEVAFESSSPALAARVVNTLVGFYLEKRLEAYKDPRSIGFLESKAIELRYKVEKAEEKLKEFKQGSKIVSYEQEKSFLVTQEMQLKSSIQDLEMQTKINKEKIEVLQKQLKSVPETVADSEAANRVGGLQSQLLELQMQEADLLTRYQPTNRLVVNIRKKIQMLREYLQEESKASEDNVFISDNPVYQEFQKEILATQAEVDSFAIRKKELQSRLDEAKSRLGYLETLENQYAQLNRDLEGYRKEYQSYEQRLEQSRLYEELEQQKLNSVSVLEPARPPLIPVDSPLPLKLLLAAALAFSAGGALGVGFLLDLTDHTVMTPEDAESRLAVPVLATIPYKSNRAVAKKAGKRRSLLPGRKKRR